MSSSDSEPSLSIASKALILDEINGAAARLFDVLEATQRHQERPTTFVRTLLQHLDQLHYQVENLRSLAATAALADGFTNASVRDWLGVSAADTPRYTGSAWSRAQVAAAQGKPCPADDLESQEAYTAAQHCLEHRDPSRAVANLAQLLALAYVWDYDVEAKTWLDERTAKCIKHGWYPQPKRVPTQAKAAMDDNSPSGGESEPAVNAG